MATMPDLSTTIPSRMVYVDNSVKLGEDAPATGHIIFTLPGDLHVNADILQASSVTMHLRDGVGEVRLPTYATGVRSELGGDWHIIVKKSWNPAAYTIRVPAGSGRVSLASIGPVRPLRGREQQYAITSATVNVTQGTGSSTARLNGGTLAFQLAFPGYAMASIAGLQAALDAKFDKAPFELNAGRDANLLLEQRRYIASTNALAQTMQNFPEPRAGFLDVTTNVDRTHVWQAWRPFSTPIRMYLRTRYNNVWSAWEQVVTDSDPRLTNARTPTSHTHTVADVTGLATRLAPVEYDSGERNITELIPERRSGSLYIQRVGRTIWLTFDDLVCNDQSTSWHSWSNILPVGWRPTSTTVGYRYMPLAPTSSAHSPGPMRVDRFGSLLVYNTTGQRLMRGYASWNTNDAVPTAPLGANT